MSHLGENGISDPTCHGNAISGHSGLICPGILLPFFIVFLCPVGSAQTTVGSDEFHGIAGSLGKTSVCFRRNGGADGLLAGLLAPCKDADVVAPDAGRGRPGPEGGGTEDRFLSSVGMGLRPAKSHEKPTGDADWANGGADPLVRAGRPRPAAGPTI